MIRDFYLKDFLDFLMLFALILVKERVDPTFRISPGAWYFITLVAFNLPYDFELERFNILLATCVVTDNPDVYCFAHVELVLFENDFR